MTNGALITLEGIDGSGKTTVWNSLQEVESIAGTDNLTFTREPTTNKFGQMLREILAEDNSDPLSELFLFMADHCTHLHDTVLPALSRNEIVICDRYIDSRCAYQGHTLTGEVPNPIEFIHDLHQPWSRTPDCTIYLSIDAETAVERTSSGEKYEVEDRLMEIRENYATLMSMSPDRFAVVDATQSPDSVLADVVDVLTDRFSTGI